MKKFSGRHFAALATMFATLVASRTDAGIITATAAGDATIQATPDGTAVSEPAGVSYPVNFAGSGPLSGSQFASAFTETITGTGQSVKTFTYDPQRDTGLFTGVNRLVLNITDGVSAPGLKLAAVNFLFVPIVGQVSINGGVSYGGSYSPGNPGTMTFNGVAYGFNHQNGSGQADGFEAVFSTPVAFGGTTAVYVPLAFSTEIVPGSFAVIQTPIFTPEPSSLMMFGLGLVTVGTGAWMKKRKANSMAV